jgi:hypothetical protein
MPLPARTLSRLPLVSLLLFAMLSIGARDCINSPWMVGDSPPPVVINCGGMGGAMGTGTGGVARDPLRRMSVQGEGAIRAIRETRAPMA